MFVISEFLANPRDQQQPAKDATPEVIPFAGRCNRQRAKSAAGSVPFMPRVGQILAPTRGALRPPKEMRHSNGGGKENRR